MVVMALVVLGAVSYPEIALISSPRLIFRS